ncbi:MAG: type II 3-dehydroquinate dehydratase [Pseudoflavonifractor sp.]
MEKKRILVLNGANMDTLGKRDTGALGCDTLDSIMAELAVYAQAHHVELTCVQSNFEGELIQRLHEADGSADAVILNPGSFVHYARGLQEAISGLPVPCIEVHLANFFRKPENHSVLAVSCRGVVCGFGKASYQVALDGLLRILA